MKFKPPAQKREGVQRLGDIPAFQQILESRKRKEGIEPEHAMPQPEMQPAPEGFKEIAYHPDAGIRVTQSKDQSTTAIQFDEQFRAIRGGMNSEVELLAIEGFSYQPKSRQWERYDLSAPEANRVSAKRFGEELAERRTGAAVSR